MKKILLFLLISLFSFGVFAQGVKYQDPVFSKVKVTKNVKYGTASNYLGLNQNLYLDIYEPDGDQTVKRPMVMMIFGGAFVVGRKEATDIVAWCNDLAKHGYVCVSINYRLGFTVGSSRSATRAAYRAVQDARAAMRYLIRNKNTYRLDPTRLFIGGESAGAITALHTVFMDTDAKRPNDTRSAPWYTLENSDMGCLDCSGNNISETFSFKGIINIWGAISDVSFITNANKIPVVSIHGTSDVIVPINAGTPFSLTYLFPTLYGSNPLTNRLNTLNVYNEFYPYQGEGHVFYGVPDLTFPNSKWPGVFQQGKNFLYTRLQQMGNLLRESEEELQIVPLEKVYQSEGVFIADVNTTSEQDATFQIYNISGQLQKIHNEHLFNGFNEVQVPMEELPAGVYVFVALIDGKHYSMKVIRY